MSGDVNLNELLRSLEEVPAEESSRCIVRLRTSSWRTRNGLHLKKDITFMRRMSSGCQILDEDANNIGAGEVLERVVNLSECEDGLYEVRVVNTRTDWETGYVDDYDYELVPFHPNPKPETK